MTEEELSRAMRERAAMMNTKPSLETRIDRLEREALERRTAILKLERDIKMLAGAVALAGIVALTFKIALEVRT